MSRPFGIPTNAPNLPPGESEMVAKAQPMSEQNEGRVTNERLAQMIADVDSVIKSANLAGGAEYDIYPAEFLRVLHELQALRASSRGEGEKK